LSVPAIRVPTCMHTSHLGFVLAEDTAWKNKLDFVFFTKQ